MINTMKKWISIVMVLTLLLTSFSGCGKTETNDGGTSSGGTSGDTSSTGTETGTDTETSGDEKPSGTITVWGWEFVEKSLSANMEAFQAEYPDIEVLFEVYGTNDVYQKMLLGLSAGGEGLPDVVTVETSHLAQFVNVGGLMDLTDHVAPYIEHMNAFKWTDASQDGRIYAMPWDSGPVALYYRTDVFEAAGLPTDPSEVSVLLDTWDDYYEAAKIIKEKTGSFMYAESQEMSNGRNFEKLLWQQGKFYFDEAGNPQLNTPEAVRALEFVTKFAKEGLADNVEEWTQPWYDGLSNGNLATMFAAVWMGGFLYEWIAPDAEGLWRVIPLPRWAESQGRASNDGGSNFIIPDTSSNKDAAWAYVEFMLGREDSHIRMFKETDVFPSLETTYDDPFFEEEMSYYGGQAIRLVFADVVPEIPSIAYTSNYTQANESLVEAFAQVIYNNMSVEDALEQANEQVKIAIQ